MTRFLSRGIHWLVNLRESWEWLQVRTQPDLVTRWRALVPMRVCWYRAQLGKGPLGR